MNKQKQISCGFDPLQRRVSLQNSVLRSGT